MTKRPESHIRIPMRWEEEPILADMAYLNSPLTQPRVRFYSPQRLNSQSLHKELDRKKDRTLVEFGLKGSVIRTGRANIGVPTRPSYPVKISITVQLCTFSKLKLSDTVVRFAKRGGAV
jgi:hypothetical protein